MACNSCGNTNGKGKCGCQDTAYNTIPTYSCPPNASCPSPEACSEFTDANCTLYTGYGIVDLGINTGDRLNTVIQKLILLATNPDCVTPGNDCQSITNLTINSVTDVTIIPQWPLVATAINYQVEYKLATDVTWTLLPLLGPTLTMDTISGLIPETAYHVRVNSICTIGNCYSVTLSVTTTE